ncbi:DUF421 domain-containing protein [Halalkalibacter krulwichiae]|uniref:YetF C-terminal domain-containing protein n=1 Tax=Halalkalibacter krulwichiae TaxID=199441 RepID=A0A1X9MA05_9BACI|nr:DUF421 domain-containing protein [Halalkalibacter krulwichiae]ARK30236.1 hypothetical protein BkAM31D_10565 [Halalkalibacter krulwichiae]
MQGWVEVALRSFLGFILFVAIARMFIRKPIGETSQLEFGLIASVAVIFGIGSIQLAIPLSHLLIALFIWAGGTFAILMLSMKNATFRAAIYGKGIPIMKDGKILEDNMKKQHLTSDELLRKLRGKQVFQVADVEFAVLEGNGELNVLVKKEQQPITAKMLDHYVAPIKEPETVIMDGKILHEPLATRGLSEEWLKTELKKSNAIVENVFLAQVDEYGQVTFDLFDDVLQVAKPTELPLLEASIKKAQADLELFALDTEDKQAKKMYSWCAEQMKNVHSLVSPFTKS